MEVRKEIEVFYFANREPLFMFRPDSLRKNWQRHDGGFLFRGSMEIWEDWQESVYSTGNAYDREAWDKLSYAIKQRDRFHCQRCDHLFSHKRLTVHHLVPRIEGGTDDPRNLVTLCSSCHDIVEDKRIATARDMRLDYWAELDAEEKVRFGNKLRKNQYNVDYDDWHVWVYGVGRKRR